MRFYLLYGLLPTAILFALVFIRTQWLWRKARSLTESNSGLPPIRYLWTGRYVVVWIKGVSIGLGILLLSVIAHFLYDEDPWLVAWAMWFIAIFTWAAATSWAKLMLASVRNTQAILIGPPGVPFIAYLRDRREEEREEFGGMPGQEMSSPTQRGIRRLAQSVSETCLYGFWDPKDKRTGLHFSPLISTEERWRHNVVLLCERAAAIVLDISNLSPSLEWEARLILERPEFGRKTLLLRAQTDKELPETLQDLQTAVRWVVLFESRDEGSSSSDPLDLPADFVTLARHCAQPGAQPKLH